MRASYVCFALILTLAPASGAVAQEGDFSGWDGLVRDDFVFDPDISEVATFAIQVSGEVRHRIHQAREAMKEGRFREASEPLQDLINLYPNHLYQVSEKQWVGAAEYAKFLLASFPPEGRKEYARWAELRVDAVFERARREGDETALRSLADRWVVTPQGLEALRILGDLAQERGQHSLAERYYRRRLLFEEPPTPETADIALRAAAALVFQGSGDEAELLLESHADSTVRVGGISTSARDALEHVLPFSGVQSDVWPVFGGSNDHASLVNFGSGEFRLTDLWQAPAFSRPERNPYRSRVSDLEFPFHPVLTSDALIVNDGLAVRNFSHFSPEPRWEYQGPLYEVKLSDEYYTLTDYLRRSTSPLGSLARSIPLSATVADDLVIAPLIDLQERGRRISYDETPINPPIPRRSLYAIDIETGELRWKQRRPQLDEEAFINRLSITVPPVVMGDRVLAAGYILEGAINVYAICLSLKDGSLLWKTPIVVGQQELTMFNKTFKEFSLQMPAEKGGSLYLSTNLGLFACVDSLTGNLRWVIQYESIPIQRALHYSQNRERATSSNNDAPVVKDGVVVFAPLDSNDVFAVDDATGNRLWKRSSNLRRGSSPGYSYILGVDQGMMVLGSRYGIGFFDLTTGLMREYFGFSGIRNPYTRGRGCLGEGVVYQPLYAHLLVLRWRVTDFGIEINDQFIDWNPDYAGNLLFHDDLRVSMSREQMTVFFDIDLLVAEVREKILLGSTSIEDLILLGDLECLRRDHVASIDAYHQALTHADVSDDSTRRIRDGLYRNHRDLARAFEGVDVESRLRHLEEEAFYAADDHAFLQTAEAMLDIHHNARDYPRYLAVLDQMDARCPNADYNFEGHKYGGLVRTGVYTLERRSGVAIARGQPEEAIAAWQQMIRRHPHASIEGVEVRKYAQDRIERAMETYGPEIYLAFEEEAAELHEAARRDEDVGALFNLIEQYPNSVRSVSHRLDLARTLLSRDEAARVFEVLSPLLVADIPRAEQASALLIMAKAAEVAGSRALASSVWRRVSVVGGELPIHGGEGGSYRTVAQVEIERLETTVAGFDRGMTLQSLPDLEPRVFALDLKHNTNVIPIVAAKDSPGSHGVLVYQVEETGSDPRAYVRLIDTQIMEERWRTSLDDYFHQSDPVRAYLIGESLLIRQQRVIRAVDPRDGSLLFRKPLPFVPSFTVMGRGLLFFLWNRLDGVSQLVAMEPASGSFFWQREIPGGVLDVQSAGDLLLVRKEGGVLLALDSLTGKTAYSRSLLEIVRGTDMLAFPEFGLLLATGVGEGERKARLVAFDLEDGRRLWDHSGLPYRLSVRWIHRDRDRLVLLLASSTVGSSARGVFALRVLEPRSGRVLREVEGLEKLTELEVGPTVVSGHAVLVKKGRASRRGSASPEMFVLVDLDRGEVSELSLMGLPRDKSADFTVFATTDGKMCGTVDISSMPRSGCESQVFTLDPQAEELNIVPISSQFNLYRSTPVTTSGSLAVLKDDHLLVYPVTENER